MERRIRHAACSCSFSSSTAPIDLQNTLPLPLLLHSMVSGHLQGFLQISCMCSQDWHSERLLLGLQFLESSSQHGHGVGDRICGYCFLRDLLQKTDRKRDPDEYYASDKHPSITKEPSLQSRMTTQSSRRQPSCSLFCRHSKRATGRDLRTHKPGYSSFSFACFCVHMPSGQVSTGPYCCSQAQLAEV